MLACILGSNSRKVSNLPVAPFFVPSLPYRAACVIKSLLHTSHHSSLCPCHHLPVPLLSPSRVEHQNVTRSGPGVRDSVRRMQQDTCCSNGLVAHGPDPTITVNREECATVTVHLLMSVDTAELRGGVVEQGCAGIVMVVLAARSMFDQWAC